MLAKTVWRFAVCGRCGLWVPGSRPWALSCDSPREALMQMIGGWHYDCSI